MHKEILKLAIPNILSNISIPLLSSVDTLLMGQLSVNHLGAIGVGSMIFNFLYWNFGFLRMANTGMTAQAYGAQAKPEVTAILWRSLLIAGIVSFALLLLSPSLLKAGLYLMDVQESQQNLVASYFSIRILAAPASLGLYCLMGWFFGLQNAVYPLIVTVLINLLNILLSSYFVNTLNWGIEGVAWGTVLAQYLGVVACFFLILYRYSERVFWRAHDIFLAEKLKGLVKVNTNIFLRTLALTLVIAFLTAQASGLGEIPLGIHVVLMQFFVWMSYGVDGFAFASESLTGKYFGSKQPGLLKQAIRFSFAHAGMLSLFFSLFYFAAFEPLFSVFTEDPTLKTLAFGYRGPIALMPVLAFSCFIWDGIFVGLTLSKEMRSTMLAAAFCFFASFYLSPTMDLNLLWMLFMAFLMLRAIFQFLLFKKKAGPLLFRKELS